MTDGRELAICVTGASGILYAKRLFEAVCGIYDTVCVVASKTAESIAQSELGCGVLQLIPKTSETKFVVFDIDDFSAPIASGSHSFEGVVVVPCSMGALGRVAAGVSSDLICRCVDVCLKERRKTVFVTRETPLSLIHIKNMLTVTEAGGVVMPACPAFYGSSDTVGDLVDFVVDRIMRILGNDGITDGWRND